MSWRLRFSSAAAINASFASAAAVLAFVGWTLYEANADARAAVERVDHSREVLRTIGGVRENFALAEAAQRGYLLSGGSTFIAERERAIGQLNASIGSLAMLTADNPGLQEKARHLSELAAQRMRLAAQNAQTRAQNGFAGQWPTELLSVAHEAAERVLQLTTRMEEEELRLLTERQALDLERQRRSSIAIGGAFLAFLAVLLPAYWGVLYQARRRRQTERQMTELVESMPVAVWQQVTGRDLQRRYVYVSPSSARKRGFSPEALLRDRGAAMESVLPQDRERVMAAMAYAERTLEPLDHNFRVRRPDGAVRWLHSRATLQRREDGSILWTGFWADITEQKALEQALQDATEAANSANRAKSSFLATMSHEIRTPMNGVLGLLELLSLSRLDSEQRATLGVVRESGRSLLRIIDDILDFSKVEAGRLSLDPVPASVCQALSRACQIHSGIASSRGLLLEQSTDPRISPALLFDPLRLGQILNNFISNGLKFTTEGRVKVAAELVDRSEGHERIRFTVQDTGIGVSQEVAQNLFEPFAQAGVETSARYGGTGLGLAICKRLAVLMNGSVEMHSEPGKGTCMVLDVRFPIADPAALAEVQADASHRQLTHAVSARRVSPGVAEAEKEGTLVLVVDDHPTNRLVLSRQVTALGYGMLSAENGLEALALWKSRRIGLVLTDCNMPELNGYELARAIRAQEAERGGTRVPIVACTANALNSEAAKCLAAGMDDFLVKPVDLIELMERLDQWLPLAPAQEPAPPLAPPPGVDGFIDLEMLRQISGGDSDTQRQILLDFRHVNDADLALLRRAVAERNTDNAIRLSHRMKGAAQTLGAAGLAVACESLDRAARSADPAALDAQLRALEEELGRLNTWLDPITATPAPASGPRAPA